jgi:hypothetical protein
LSFAWTITVRVEVDVRLALSVATLLVSMTMFDTSSGAAVALLRGGGGR